jgi:PD-(D/E)XK nuclease superfamily protein
MIDAARQAEGDGEHDEAAALPAALARYKVAEATDGTEFRKKARLLASLWREARGLPPGAHYVRRGDGTMACRELGSRLDLSHAKRTGANFLTPAIRRQVRDRLARPEDHELIQEQRLWADLLSSQPMCFNLFGELAADLELATSAARAWWPDRVERVTELRFEWSPGRLDPRYLGNRTAFDAVLKHTTSAGGRGFIGIETKYHERAERPNHLRPERLERYAEVTERSGVFRPGWEQTLAETDLQQIWLDHLLALSMLPEWDCGLFVLLYPAANTSMAGAARRYVDTLLDATTFEHRTLEAMTERLRDATNARWVAAFEDRYLDFEKLRAVGVSPPAL